MRQGPLLLGHSPVAIYRDALSCTQMRYPFDTSGRWLMSAHVATLRAMVRDARHTIGLTAAALLTGLLAACSSSSSGPAATSQGSSVAPAATTQVETLTVTASPTTSTAGATPASDAPLKLKAVYKAPDFTVQVLKYRKNSAPDAPSPARGGRWDSVEARVCLPQGAEGVSWSPWSLRGSADQTFETSNLTYNQFLQPEYPFSSGRVPAGDCLRGWITFGVTKSAKVTTAQYQRSDDSGDTTTIRWRLT